MRPRDGYCWLVIGWWLCGFTIRGSAEPRIQSESQVTELCSDARCSCSPISVTCHCSPQDQVITISTAKSTWPLWINLLQSQPIRPLIRLVLLTSWNSSLDFYCQFLRPTFTVDLSSQLVQSTTEPTVEPTAEPTVKLASRLKSNGFDI